jgi:ribosome-associated protein
MTGALAVTRAVRVPESALAVRAVRSSGPGGQNVNKVASKIELRVDLGLIEGLPEDARARLLTLARNRLDAQGLLLVTSQRTRDQHRNLEDARQKVREILLRALLRPKVRRPTRVTKASKNARVEAKKKRGQHKRSRRPVGPDEG